MIEERLRIDRQGPVTNAEHDGGLATASVRWPGNPGEVSTVDMTVTELDGPVTCVRLHGRLDAAGADSIGIRFTAAIAAQQRAAVVDLSGVVFIASLGLRLLISTAKGLSMRGHRMALFGATELVQGVFDDAALEQIMPIVATEAEALAAARD